MTQFIKEFGILDLNLQNEIISICGKYTNDLDQSQLYSSVEEKKFVDLDKRSSKYKSIVDNELFDSVDKLVKILNGKDKFYEYKII